MKKLLMILSCALMLSLAATPYVGAQMYIHPGAVGDALLGEFYRVNMEGDATDFTTFFTIANTSDEYVTIHVRLRSGRYSVEVWDKQFELTPFDKIWFQLGWSKEFQEYRIYGETLNAKGDKLKKGLINDVTFAAPAEDKDVSIGYIEVFGIHAWNREMGWFSSVPNRLMGHVYLGNWATGEYMGYQMLAFADFRSGHTDHRDLSYHGIIDKELTAEYPQWKFVPNDSTLPDGAGTIVPGDPLIVNPYINSDWATTYGPTWNDGDDFSGSGTPVDPSGPYANKALAEIALATANLGPSAVWSLDEVESALYKAGIMTEYFNMERASGSQLTTLATVTFPAKYLHYFWQNWNPAIGLGNTSVATGKRNALKEPPPGVPLYNGKLYDMAENLYGWSPTGLDDFPYEVNLVPVGDISQEYFKEWPLVYLSGPFDTYFEAGWFWLGFRPAEVDDDDQLEDFRRGLSIYPGNNLVMQYEDENNLHARGFPWSFTWCDPNGRRDVTNEQ